MGAVLPLVEVATGSRGQGVAYLGGDLAMSLNLYGTDSPFACAIDSADYAQLTQVAPGQLVSLIGTNIGTGSPINAQPQGGLWPTSVGNALGVTFNGIPAPILYSSAGQYQCAGAV